jgi:pimeloyl-ACP methyl ester carboxylesterase
VNTIERVSRITIPTLVLWGEDDQLDPPETARLLYDALICKKQLHIIPGNGHVGHLDRNRGQVFTLTANWALENLA